MVGNETVTNYLLFAFDEYQGSGGINDLQACFGAISDESAIEMAVLYYCKPNLYAFDIYQLVAVSHGACRNVEFDYSKMLEAENSIGEGI